MYVNKTNEREGSVSTNESPTNQDPAEIIDRLVVSYNARDPRAFADLFSVDAIHGGLRSDSQQIGRESIYERYVDVFSQFPLNRTEVIHRVVTGKYVVDHERVRRIPDSEAFDVVAIYELQNGEIVQLDFVRA